MSVQAERFRQDNDKTIESYTRIIEPGSPSRRFRLGRDTLHVKCNPDDSVEIYLSNHTGRDPNALEGSVEDQESQDDVIRQNLIHGIRLSPSQKLTLLPQSSIGLELHHIDQG